jgi:hypothetical protein
MTSNLERLFGRTITIEAAVRALDERLAQLEKVLHSI